MTTPDLHDSVRRKGVHCSAESSFATKVVSVIVSEGMEGVYGSPREDRARGEKGMMHP